MKKIDTMIKDIQTLREKEKAKLNARDLAGINKIVYELELLNEKLVDRQKSADADFPAPNDAADC